MTDTDTTAADDFAAWLEGRVNKTARAIEDDEPIADDGPTEPTAPKASPIAETASFNYPTGRSRGPADDLAAWLGEALTFHQVRSF